MVLLIWNITQQTHSWIYRDTYRAHNTQHTTHNKQTHTICIMAHNVHNIHSLYTIYTAHKIHTHTILEIIQACYLSAVNHIFLHFLQLNNNNGTFIYPSNIQFISIWDECRSIFTISWSKSCSYKSWKAERQLPSISCSTELISNFMQEVYQGLK